MPESNDRIPRDLHDAIEDMTEQEIEHHIAVCQARLFHLRSARDDWEYRKTLGQFTNPSHDDAPPGFSGTVRDVPDVSVPYIAIDDGMMDHPEMVDLFPGVPVRVRRIRTHQDSGTFTRVTELSNGDEMEEEIK
jgi:hypothetical protein